MDDWFTERVQSFSVVFEFVRERFPWVFSSADMVFLQNVHLYLYTLHWAVPVHPLECCFVDDDDYLEISFWTCGGSSVDSGLSNSSLEACSQAHRQRGIT